MADAGEPNDRHTRRRLRREVRQSTRQTIRPSSRQVKSTRRIRENTARVSKWRCLIPEHLPSNYTGRN